MIKSRSRAGNARIRKSTLTACLAILTAGSILAGCGDSDEGTSPLSGKARPGAGTVASAIGPADTPADAFGTGSEGTEDFDPEFLGKRTLYANITGYRDGKATCILSHKEAFPSNTQFTSGGELLTLDGTPFAIVPISEALAFIDATGKVTEADVRAGLESRSPYPRFLAYNMDDGIYYAIGNKDQEEEYPVIYLYDEEMPLEKILLGGSKAELEIPDDAVVRLWEQDETKTRLEEMDGKRLKEAVAGGFEITGMYGKIELDGHRIISFEQIYMP